MTKLARNGRSIEQGVMQCSRDRMHLLGFDDESIDRMMRVRRALEYVDDETVPCLDARKLWERIGKPYGRFNDWVSESAVNTFTAFTVKGQVEPFLEETKGRPRKDYRISRRVAVLVSMEANTPEGMEIREYFADMETLVNRLASYNPLRARSITSTDNQIYHTAMVRHGSRQAAQQTEIDLKRACCFVLTGLYPKEWTERVGKPIRDCLQGDDVAHYDQCYKTMQALYNAEMELNEIVRIANVTFQNKINAAKYMH